MNQEITAEQALNVLVQAIQTVKFTLADGETIKQCIQVLVKAIQPVEKSINPDKED